MFFQNVNIQNMVQKCVNDHYLLYHLYRNRKLIFCSSFVNYRQSNSVITSALLVPYIWYYFKFFVLIYCSIIANIRTSNSSIITLSNLQKDLHLSRTSTKQCFYHQQNISSNRPIVGYVHNEQGKVSP